jgi:3-oxoacyl-[acyl-carrier protein] reductase
MELGLRGRTALVSGASSGLGLASAEALTEEGANVTMFARRRDELDRHSNRLGALAVRGDVTNEADLERAVSRTLEAFGGLDILVWNGGGPPAGTASSVTDDELEAAFDLLLLSAVRLVRACLPHLRASDAGRIVLITSGAVKEPSAHLALSNAFRPGLTGWAKSLARDVGADGITVNCVAPGRIDTPRMAEIYGESGPPQAELAQIPLGRMGAPRELGDVVCFLASQRASYVNGVTLLVDGGASRSLL